MKLLVVHLAIGLQLKIKKCSNYQAVVPTTWNACPRDEVAGQGAFERAMMDTAVKIPEKPFRNCQSYTFFLTHV